MSPSTPITRIASTVFAALLLATTATLVRAEDEDREERERRVPVEAAPAGVRINGIRLQPTAAVLVNFTDLARQEALRAGARPPVRALLIPELEEPGEPFSAFAPSPNAAPLLPLVASPSPTTTFMGLDDIPMVDSSYIVIPPDVGGAVGQTRILQGLNNNYRILNKADGSVISTVGTATFWAPTGETALNGLTDPRTLYDPINDRWIVEMQTVTSGAGNLLIGVSQTSDPAGNWYLFRYTGIAATIDFPIMGFNKNWLAVTINRYSLGGVFQRGVTLVADYGQLRTGLFFGTLFVQAANTHFCSAPCVTYSPTSDTLYVVTHLASSGATYAVDLITGTPTAPVYTTGITQTRPGGGWVQPSGQIIPQSAPNAGASVCTPPCKIEAQDAQIRSAPVFRGGSIYYAQSIGLPVTGLTHMAAQWTKLTTPSGAVVDGGRVDDPTATSTNGGKWYSCPHIAVNASGDFIVGYTQFSSAQHPGTGYSVHLAGDAAGTLRDPLIYKTGEDYYHKDFGGGRNRWGDFSQAQVDPTDDQTLWVVNEYGKTRTGTNDGTTGANSSKWSTYWAKLAFVVPPTVTLSPGPTQNEGDAGQTAFTFTANLSAASAAQVTVHYLTGDGSATGADNDYVPVVDSVTIAPGNLSGPINIQVNGDTLCEPDEGFLVHLTSATNGVIGAPATATGTILADDSLTITATAGPHGSISPVGAVSVPCFADQAFTITPDAGYQVGQVLVDGVSAGPQTLVLFQNVVQDHTIDAIFARITHTVQVAVVGGGSVAKNPNFVSYDDSSSVELTATPDSGFTFTGWSGDASGNDNPLTVLVDGDKSITATFADVAPPIAQVLAPNGGENLMVGTEADFLWTAIDNDTVTVVDLLLSRNGAEGPFESIADAVPNSGLYAWTVVGPTSDSALVKVVAHDPGANVAEDVSDSLFAISDATAADPKPVTSLALASVQPNPAISNVSFQFALPREAEARLAIMDVQGREVAVLASGRQSPGWHTVRWNGRSASGKAGPGVYFAELKSESQRIVRRFALIH